MRLVFDLYSLSAPTAWEHFFNITLALVCTVAGLFAWRRMPAWNTPGQRWTQFSHLYMSLFLLVLAASFVVGEVRALAHSEQRTIAKWIDEQNYEVATGPIADLVLQEKFWKTDPIPTFVVGRTSFEYGVYSRNNKLQNHLAGGPLLENRQVTVWHRAGLILRLYVEDQPPPGEMAPSAE